MSLCGMNSDVIYFALIFRIKLRTQIMTGWPRTYGAESNHYKGQHLSLL